MKRKNRTIYRILILLSVLLLSGCGKDPPQESPEYGEVSIGPAIAEEESEHNALLPEFEGKSGNGLPEEEVSDRTVIDGYDWYPVPSMGISLNVPAGSSVTEKDSYNLVIKDGDTEYFLHKFFNSSFENPADIAGAASPIIKGTTFRYKGMNFSPTIFDTLSKNTVLTEKGFEIACEKPYIIIAEDNGVRAAEPEMAVCYYLYQNDPYVLYALSEQLTYEQLLPKELNIISSMRAYVPSAESEEITLGKNIRVGKGICVSVPDAWKTGTSAGMTVSKAPESSIYSGTEILVFVDEEYRFCEDYLSLGVGFSEKYITYKCKNGAMLYKAENTRIGSFAEHIRNGIQAYYFDVTDTVYPTSASDQLPPEGNVFRSYRYVFEDAGENPCIVLISYSEGKEYLIYELAERIADTIMYISEN